MNNLQNEWSILHSDIEKYERFSLLIKLFSLLICLLATAYTLNEWFTILLILILWLQNGIWKTFQGRLESRILNIEQHLLNKTSPDDIAFQLYSQWQGERQGALELIKEYCNNSFKPTVAYPYILLVIVVLVIY